MANLTDIEDLDLLLQWALGFDIEVKVIVEDIEATLSRISPWKARAKTFYSLAY